MISKERVYDFVQQYEKNDTLEKKYQKATMFYTEV